MKFVTGIFQRSAPSFDRKYISKCTEYVCLCVCVEWYASKTQLFYGEQKTGNWPQHKSHKRLKDNLKDNFKVGEGICWAKKNWLWIVENSDTPLVKDATPLRLSTSNMFKSNAVFQETFIQTCWQICCLESVCACMHENINVFCSQRKIISTIWSLMLTIGSKPSTPIYFYILLTIPVSSEAKSANQHLYWGGRWWFRGKLQKIQIKSEFIYHICPI